MSSAAQGAWSSKTSYQFMGGVDTSGDTGGFTGEQFLSAFTGSGVPIPPTARSLIVQNQAGNDITVLLTFHLAF
jgi:hypothetical protein